MALREHHERRKGRYTVNPITPTVSYGESNE